MKLAASARRGPLTIRGRSCQDRKSPVRPFPRFALPAGHNRTPLAHTPSTHASLAVASHARDTDLRPDFRAFFAQSLGGAVSFSPIKKSLRKVGVRPASFVDEANTHAARVVPGAVPAALVSNSTTLFTEPGSGAAETLVGTRTGLSGRSDP